MENDIVESLTTQVKKEIAERYFGYRRMIEEDITTLKEEARRLERMIYEKIAPDLCRIYIMLKDRSLIEKFAHLIGLSEPIFYDDYLTQSKTIRRRLFRDLKVWGLTSHGRFRKLLQEIYQRLRRNVSHYRTDLAELKRHEALVNEEIRHFGENFSLSEILSFLGELDRLNTGTSLVEEMSEVGAREKLERSLAIPPLKPPSQELPDIPELPPLTQIRGELKRLADEAWPLHNRETIEAIVH
ncbi:hypothetical protein G4V39_07530 [Thermosulfuriphilus ammonigenes]|uniref:Uncharacterized protein n=1 Tax=Thermosulfuriphilus ammonigenes TaxID=1936021 RepID=A0A6G7PX47_9BACT|nr:hypothetical protein [Thermosulfuriphilus ammonigenes]MBA2847664.1 hypothetical protein [Thermosulfuriphilus ammonigenes]QIJ72126.1 hypothetical protein G4V39_07530 [Thermosulfuriphilus ammonigenes]